MFIHVLHDQRKKEAEVISELQGCSKLCVHTDSIELHAMYTYIFFLICSIETCYWMLLAIIFYGKEDTLPNILPNDFPKTMNIFRIKEYISVCVCERNEYLSVFKKIDLYYRNSL